MTKTLQKALFGAGCFWGIEAAFRKVKGVKETAVGFAGGTVENPSYEQVCRHGTGHAEVVQVFFDPKEVSYKELLDVFWQYHNPTTMNRQGFDIGTEYRSVIFYYTDYQKELADASKEEHQKTLKKPIVTAIENAPQFYKAEEYHQRYLEKRGKAVC